MVWPRTPGTPQGQKMVLVLLVLCLVAGTVGGAAAILIVLAGSALFMGLLEWHWRREKEE